MLTAFEKVVRIEALKYFLGGDTEGRFTGDLLDDKINEFLDGDEATQKVGIKYYIEKRLIPYYEMKEVEAQSVVDGLVQTQAELDRLKTYRDNN